MIEEMIESWERWSKLENPLPFKKEIMVGWAPPPLPKVNINSDGAAKGNPGAARAGCILGNEQERWIVGAARNLGVTTSICTECGEFCGG